MNCELNVRSQSVVKTKQENLKNNAPSNSINQKIGRCAKDQLERKKPGEHSKKINVTHSPSLYPEDTESNIGIAEVGIKGENLPNKVFPGSKSRRRRSCAKRGCRTRTTVQSDPIQATSIPLPSKNIVSPSEKIASSCKDNSSKNNWLEKLNCNLPLLIEQLEKEDRLDASTKTLLMNMAYDYFMSLKYMCNTCKIPPSQIEKVIISTILDSEFIDMKEKGIFELVLSGRLPPNSFLTLSLIIKWFEEFSLNETLPIYKKMVCNHLSECCSIFFAIKLVNEYVPDKVKGYARELIGKHLKEQILRLKNQEQIVLPGGWANLPQEGLQGHFMFYLLERRDASTFIKIRINTHASVEFTDTKNRLSEVLEELIRVEHIDEFISNLLDLQFPQTLLNRINQISERDEFLFQTGRKYSEKVFSLPFGIELQRDSFNCCFMACLIFYQYIYYKSENTQLNDVNYALLEKSKETASIFRKQFQGFLLSLLTESKNQ